MQVRILDAPGLADARGPQQDALHKKSIETEIQNHLDSVNAVLILVNGSVPRISVSTDYALSALLALFPKSMANNIAFLVSNTPNEVYLNFPDDDIPEVLKHAPKFLINNPIALQKNYLKQKDRMNERNAKKRKGLVKGAEQDALKMLVKLFDWLDGLEPQPTREIITHYESMEEQGISRDQLEKMRGGPDDMKRRPGVLRKATGAIPITAYVDPEWYVKSLAHMVLPVANLLSMTRMTPRLSGRLQ